MRYSRSLGAVAALLCVGYALLDRLGHRWGASDDEVFAPLPGDGAAPHPIVEATHAITIHAPAKDVWPWVLRVGEVAPSGPFSAADFSVLTLEPNRLLALYSTTHGMVWLPRALRHSPLLGLHSELVWSFTLWEPEPDTTRLILRMRATGGPALYRALAGKLLAPADFFVARLLLLRLRERVEMARVISHLEPTHPYAPDAPDPVEAREAAQA